jgi:hypothetical protein
MSLNFAELKENENLIQLVVSDKEEYYNDLSNIEQSWTGRIDATIANTFILESVQLIINALALFILLKMQVFYVLFVKAKYL